ncbi:hypothetical protein [Pyrococcus yayanosii]|uniref:Uncharacterized protein n=1 Tax=Pyrococcus yayanosii (strain CH1 / JCM 16557) TaxID=529709 RepID=F8AG62_PYRYC|nr:hypothetical protein [Pyrococcus yayanosii]AEH23898.1 hypothetical protein PYCH_01960 [Pyrococcus yayanosii CH1]
MRKVSKVIVALAVLTLMCVIVGVNGEKIINAIGFQYLDERELYNAGEFKVDILPANVHVDGYVEGRLFSVYVLDKHNLEHFKKGESFTAVYSWENINYVKLNFNTTENLYIVVKNELNEREWIHFKVKASR